MSYQKEREEFITKATAEDLSLDLNEWPAVEILIHARIHVHDMMRFL